MKEFIENLIGRLEELRIDKSNYFGVLNIIAEKYDRANEMLDDAISIVNELAEKMNLSENLTSSDGWIPCSQRLPNCEKDFLVTLRDGDVKVARYEKEENIWVDIIEGYFEYPVAAWCELPEPYKKGSETDE